MTRWLTSNPIASLLLLALALLAVCWFIDWLRSGITVECCDHSECERPQVGDIVVKVFETKRDAGDGVEAGV